MDKKISVIVPIYNSEQTLKRTLDSIINQNYKNLEIILINDGSTDNSEKICNEYAERDERIIVITQENRGVGEARNHGIDVSTGEFISFVDSDDTMDKNFYSELMVTQAETNADVTVSNVKCIRDNDTFFPYKTAFLQKRCTKEQFIKSLLNFQFGNAVWGKIFKKECIQNIKFRNIKINEDFIFFWNAVKNSICFSINFDVYYNYYIDTSASLTKNKFTKENMSMIEHIDEVVRDITIFYPYLKDDAINYYNACLFHNLILYYDYIGSDASGELYLEEIKDMLLRAKELKKITNYFLISEKNVNVGMLLKFIKEKIKGSVK